MATNRIAVMIPCLNEVSTIGKVISEFKRELPEADIYVFDNDSTDQSAEAARQAGATVFSVARRGKGNVVREMFRTIDADIYVMVDGDDTYPASCVRDLISPIADGKAEMVTGDRLSSTYHTENTRRFHSIGNILVRNIINMIFDCNIHDLLSGYRALSRRFVRSVAVQSTGFEIETELTVASIINGYAMEEVTVPYRERSAESTSKLHTVSDGIRIVAEVFRLFRDYKPMAFFTIISLIMALTAIAFNIPVVLDYMHTGKVDRFPTLFCGGFLLVCAVVLFSAGIILQVISNRNKVLMDTLLRLHDLKARS